MYRIVQCVLGHMHTNLLYCVLCWPHREWRVPCGFIWSTHSIHGGSSGNWPIQWLTRYQWKDAEGWWFYCFPRGCMIQFLKIRLHLIFSIITYTYSLQLHCKHSPRTLINIGSGTGWCLTALSHYLSQRWPQHDIRSTDRVYDYWVYWITIPTLVSRMIHE